MKKLDFVSDNFDLYQLDNCYGCISNNEMNISNAGFIDLKDIVLVFDTFLSVEAAKDMRKAINTYTHYKRLVVINSHCHDDHYIGNCVFDDGIIMTSKEAYPGIQKSLDDLVVGEERIKDVVELEAMLKDETDEKQILNIKNSLKFRRNYAHPQLIKRYPDMTFDGEINIEGTVIKSYDTAHSFGDTIAITDKVLYAGDLLFIDNHPYIGAGDPLKLKEALKELIDMNVDYYIPGHGPICKKEAVKEQIEYIDAIMKLVKENPDKELFAKDLPKKFQHYDSPSFEWNVSFLKEYLR